MTRMPVIDTDSGKQVGETEIPDDVIEAAAKVEHWLREQPSGMEVHGVTLAD